MKNIGLIILFSVVVFTISAQDEKKSRKQKQQEQTEQIRQAVENQEYVFVAQRALSMSGRTFELTSHYTLSVGKDTISAYLPYYGVAYTAPMDIMDTGIKFESKDFEYEKTDKKNKWSIAITPKDTRRDYQLQLDISSSGSASLFVNDNSRQGITFNGYIEPKKKQ